MAGVRVHWANPKLAARIPELDGIRGLAILLVITLHYVYQPTYGQITNSGAIVIARFLRLAWSGVDLFFVLSGFLIGGMLMETKPLRNYYRTFYLRRFSRILPLYAIVLGIFCILSGVIGPNSNPLLKDQIFSHELPTWSYLLFVQNFFIAAREHFGATFLIFTWSLAVEEQFYLILPFVVRRLSRRGLLLFAIGMCIAAPVFRIIALRFSLAGPTGVYVMLPCRGDSFGLGLVVSILCRNEKAWAWLNTHRRYFVLLFGLFSFGIALWALKMDGAATRIEAELSYTWMALFYTSLLLLVLVKPNRLQQWMFGRSILVRCGTVAYGLYLFHHLVLIGYHYLFFQSVQALKDIPTALVTVLSIATSATIAAVSWRFLEKPLIQRAHRVYRYGATTENRAETPYRLVRVATVENPNGRLPGARAWRVRNSGLLRRMGAATQTTTSFE